jgi:hypothetical protein
MENCQGFHRLRYRDLKKSDLQTGKAYSTKENIRNPWNAPPIERGKKYWKSWYT